MIVCTVCAFQNLDDDAFCGSCGAFLEWSGETVVPEARPEVVAEVAKKKSLRSRVQTVLALDIHAPGEHEIAADPDAAAGGPGAPGAPGRPGPGAAGPPRPGAGPPAAPPGTAAPPRPGAPTPPARPGGATPPARPGGATPPTPPGAGGPPPTRPGAGGPPPTRPAAGGPPPRPAGDAPRPPVGPAPTRPDAPAATTPADAHLLVAKEVAPPSSTTAPATPSTAASAPAAAPRVVARKEVAAGERVIGDVAGSGGPAGAVSPGSVEAVKPQRPADRPRPVKQKPTRKILPGDLICGECGEGNPPARKFCSRCGTPLTTATVAKIPWWRRLVPRRRRRSMEAGQRPWKATDGTQKKPRRGIGGVLAAAFRKLRPVIAVGVLVAGLLLGFSPDLRERVTSTVGDAKDSVMSRIQKTYGPIAPVAVTTNAELPDAPVAHAVDSNTITSWIAPGDGPEPVLVVRFDEPIDLEKVKIWNGAAVGFKDHARVRDLHFVFDTGQSFDLAVDDLPDGQDYSIGNGKGVREVEVHIVGTHRSLTGTDVGLSEIEFLVRR